MVAEMERKRQAQKPAYMANDHVHMPLDVVGVGHVGHIVA